MKLGKNFRLITFFAIMICISSVVIASPCKIFCDPYYKTSEYILIQKVTKAGQNSFTASQIRNRLIKNGFQNIKQLYLDDKGIWRALVEFKNCNFLISIDYSGVVSVQNERKKYDWF
ncbi:hypothetical protein [Bartonella schoenbuchensis]|uniref:PepSY domain-containing protein n=1 Tax=Bartonella schoenbuchensis m07a TaxID=1094496 RepID=N6VDB8_9HYPH|nr:hypothetical protein [Bartonella schoenbuchensis]ENN91780.1 hypothetical protein m07a_06650 [Bartonella schoenbuchensis m07a]